MLSEQLEAKRGGRVESEVRSCTRLAPGGQNLPNSQWQLAPKTSVPPPAHSGLPEHRHTQKKRKENFDQKYIH